MPPYRIELIPDPDEGGYTISFPDLPGCLTCGETYEDALRNAEDAKQEWLTAAMEEGIEIPEPDTLEDYLQPGSWDCTERYQFLLRFSNCVMFTLMFTLMFT